MLIATTFITAGVALAMVGGFFVVGLSGPTPAELAPAADVTSPATPDEPAVERSTTSDTPAWQDLTAEEAWGFERELASFVTDRHGFSVEIDQGGLGRKDGRPVGFEPLRLIVEDPDGNRHTTAFEKPLGASAVAAPAGVVARTAFVDVDRRDLKQLATGLFAVNRGCCTIDANGVVHVKRGHSTLQAGPIRPADYEEALQGVGLTPADVRAVLDPEGSTSEHEGFWFSPDGIDWSPVTTLNEKPDARLLAGSASGFFAMARNQLLHSADGQEWHAVHELDAVGFDRAGAQVWEDKVIASDGRTWFDASGQTGRFEPGLEGAHVRVMEEGLVALDQDGERVAFSADGSAWSTYALPEGFAGAEIRVDSSGLWAVDMDRYQILTSRDGSDWTVIPLPEDYHGLTAEEMKWVWVTGSPGTGFVVVADGGRPAYGLRIADDPE